MYEKVVTKHHSAPCALTVGEVNILINAVEQAGNTVDEMRQVVQEYRGALETIAYGLEDLHPQVIAKEALEDA